MSSFQKRMQMAIEWQIMLAILRNWCGADLNQIMESLKGWDVTKEEIIECIKRLVTTEIIEFSSEHHDFIFRPKVAISPLIKALKTKKSLPVSFDEYPRFGWRKLARLPWHD